MPTTAPSLPISAPPGTSTPMWASVSMKPGVIAPAGSGDTTFKRLTIPS